MINPIVGASHGSYPPWDEKISFFHQANEYPQVKMEHPCLTGLSTHFANYWVDHPLLILLIAPLIHGSRMIMLIYYILGALGIHTKTIVVNRSHIVVNLRLLGNSDFCNSIKPIS